MPRARWYNEKSKGFSPSPIKPRHPLATSTIPSSFSPSTSTRPRSAIFSEVISEEDEPPIIEPEVDLDLEHHTGRQHKHRPRLPRTHSAPLISTTTTTPIHIHELAYVSLWNSPLHSRSSINSSLVLCPAIFSLLVVATPSTPAFAAPPTSISRRRRLVSLPSQCAMRSVAWSPLSRIQRQRRCALSRHTPIHLMFLISPSRHSIPRCSHSSSCSPDTSQSAPRALNCMSDLISPPSVDAD